jgi:hypothetical protein
MALWVLIAVVILVLLIACKRCNLEGRATALALEIAVRLNGAARAGSSGNYSLRACFWRPAEQVLD